MEKINHKLSTKELESIKKIYQRGYQDGFEDVCSLLENFIPSLRAAMLEGLEGCSIIDDFPKEASDGGEE